MTVREAGREAPLPCRAWVEAAGKRFFKPTTPSCKPYDRDRSFTCDGQFVIEVPAGKAIVHVERGREYVPADKAVVVEQKRTVELTIDLRRWIGMAKEGWYSADLHAHFDTKRGIVTMPACGCLA